MMKKTKSSRLYFLFFLQAILLFLFKPVLASATHPDLCPAWLSSPASDTLPICPDGGLVPETFPVAAVVISDLGRDGKDSGYATEMVQKVLQASGQNNPIFILTVSDDTFEKIKTKIDQLPIPDDLKKKYKRSLVQIKTAGYTWQQDYMQAFVDPQSGQIVLREIQGSAATRPEIQNNVKKIAHATKACGFRQGPNLKTNEPVTTGYSGGNIETLPAGICLLGDRFETPEEWEKYADQVCNKGPENRIKVPTFWSYIGHTDEIMKVVRNKKEKAPCDFSVVLSSPKKAIELLRQNPDEKFLDFSSGRGGSSTELNRRRSNDVSFRGIQKICRKFFDQDAVPKEKDKNPQPKPSPSRGVSKIFDFRNWFMQNAQAVSVNKEDCSRLTNRDVYNVLTDNKELKVYNELVQAQMQNLKTDIAQKLKAKLPQCSPDFIEAPDLFFGGVSLGDQNTKPELLNGFGSSILPNQANSISINDTVISPDPFNPTFKKFMREQYKAKGLAVEFVDTFDFAHLGGGNLHCATNTIHLCRPRRSK